MHHNTHTQYTRNPAMFITHYSTQRHYSSHILRFFPRLVTVQNTICSSTWSCSPDDGHNDARNMLRQKFDNKHQIRCILLVSLSSPDILHLLVIFRGQIRSGCFQNVFQMAVSQRRTLLLFIHVHGGECFITSVLPTVLIVFSATSVRFFNTFHCPGSCRSLEFSIFQGHRAESQRIEGITVPCSSKCMSYTINCTYTQSSMYHFSTIVC